MKKLRLDPDALAVDAFDVEAPREAAGTVLGFGGAATKASCLPPTGNVLCIACV